MLVIFLVETLNLSALLASITGILTFGGTFVALYRLYGKNKLEEGKNKIEEIKQGQFNLTKMEKLEELALRFENDLKIIKEEVRKVESNVKTLENKQDTDNKTLSKFLDRLERDFYEYRDLLIKKLTNGNN